MKEPAAKPHYSACSYCGYLDWTVEKYGRVTHKDGCPMRRDPWHQGGPHPETRDAAPAHVSVIEATVTYDDPVAAYASLRRELATIFGPVQPRKGQTWNEAMLARITERLVADGK